MTKKSGLADSPFFNLPPKEENPVTPPPDLPIVVARPKKDTKQKPIKKLVMKPRDRDTMPPRNHDTATSRNHDAIIKLVRRAVKELGKEAATHRFTPDEKKSLSDIIYTYKNQGVRTSENEITRIAVNFILEDYKENGENSILEKALKALYE